MAKAIQLKIELEQEKDGRWIGAVPALPGVMAYGKTRARALAAVRALAHRAMDPSLLRQIAESQAFYRTGKKGLSFEEVFGEPLLQQKKRRTDA